MPPDAHIFILPSIHHVLRAEKLLKAAGLPFDLVPVPKEINPDCGMAVSAAPDQAPAVGRAIRAKGIPIESAYLRSGDRFVPLTA